MGAKLRVPRGGVGQGKCPTPPICVGPIYYRMQVGFKMHDRRLTASIMQFGVVSPTDYIQHYGARAEVKRHVIADIGIRVARHRQLATAFFYVRHPDCRAAYLTTCDCGVAVQAIGIDNRRQPVAMNDVVNLGCSGAGIVRSSLQRKANAILKVCAVIVSGCRHCRKWPSGHARPAAIPAVPALNYAYRPTLPS